MTSRLLRAEVSQGQVQGRLRVDSPNIQGRLRSALNGGIFDAYYGRAFHYLQLENKFKSL